jgi:hypothetical protein
LAARTTPTASAAKANASSRALSRMCSKRSCCARRRRPRAWPRAARRAAQRVCLDRDEEEGQDVADRLRDGGLLLAVESNSRLRMVKAGGSKAAQEVRQRLAEGSWSWLVVVSARVRPEFHRAL